MLILVAQLYAAKFLYRLEGSYAPKIVEKLGRNYEQVVILPVFRSAVADISSQYFAKDMHSGQRSVIEKSIKNLMMNQLKDRGFVVEAVLLKSIVLPAGLTKAIEYKLEAEQDAQRMRSGMPGIVGIPLKMSNSVSVTP